MKSSSKLSKIFLAAMVHELYKTGMGETTFEQVKLYSFPINLCFTSDFDDLYYSLNSNFGIWHTIC